MLFSIYQGKSFGYICLTHTHTFLSRFPTICIATKIAGARPRWCRRWKAAASRWMPCRCLEKEIGSCGDDLDIFGRPKTLFNEESSFCSPKKTYLKRLHSKQKTIWARNGQHTPRIPEGETKGDGYISLVRSLCLEPRRFLDWRECVQGWFEPTLPLFGFFGRAWGFVEGTHFVWRGLCLKGTHRLFTCWCFF